MLENIESYIVPVTFLICAILWFIVIKIIESVEKGFVIKDPEIIINGIYFVKNKPNTWIKVLYIKNDRVYYAYYKIAEYRYNTDLPLDELHIHSDTIDWFYKYYELLEVDMSTNDVPGHKAINNDELCSNCWAEHDDGSLILVQSTEGGRVIYMMFDLSVDPVVEYRDAMPEKGFKEHFSWKDKDSIKWTWHDKTPFPWDRVIKKGSRDGIHYASADDQISAAQKVAKSLKLRMEEFNPDKYDHLTEIVSKGKTSSRIINAFQAAINELRK